MTIPAGQIYPLFGDFYASGREDRNVTVELLDTLSAVLNRMCRRNSNARRFNAKHRIRGGKRKVIGGRR